MIVQNIPGLDETPVGVSLLAIAVGQSINVQLINRDREQAHSYKG
ncbi:hypothetical protein SAMN05216579_3809 [Pseudomonas granadensis]|nr:hypothetical protein SAMN05216579_3809 [Pseudomonas granadensis]